MAEFSSSDEYKNRRHYVSYFPPMQSEPASNSLETIDQEIERLNEETHNLIVDLKNSEKDNGSYDITKHLLPATDLYSRVKEDNIMKPYTRVYLIPYQVRPSTNGKNIVQIMLARTSDRSKRKDLDELSEDSDGIDRCLRFYSFSYQTHYKRQRFTSPEWWIKYSIDLIFCHYGMKPKTSECTVSGYLERGEDYYVFYDMSKVWLNHHYLNLDDPFWLVNLDEIVSKRTVCDMNIFPLTQVLFNENGFLRSILSRNKDQMPIGKTVYTYEEYGNMEFTMNFGTQRKNSDDENSCFSYFVNFEDCRNALFESAIFQENDKNVNKFVIMRHVITYEDTQIVDSDEYPFSENEKPWNNERIFIDKTKPMVYIWNHGLQTPVSCHNVLSSDELYGIPYDHKNRYRRFTV